MFFLALPSPPSTTTTPALPEAFFRMHWTSLSAHARLGSWYPLATHFHNAGKGKLLREDKLPLLAAAVREIYYVYGEECAWELLCHPYLDAGGRAWVGWSYEGVVKEGEGVLDGDGKEEGEGLWDGIRRRAEEVGLRMGKEVELVGVEADSFARVAEKEGRW